MTSSLAARDVPSVQGIKVSRPPAAAFWRKSRMSGTGGACLEVARAHEQVWVRDSKDPLGSVLGFSGQGWVAFLVGVQRDEF